MEPDTVDDEDQPPVRGAPHPRAEDGAFGEQGHHPLRVAPGRGQVRADGAVEVDPASGARCRLRTGQAVQGRTQPIGELRGEVLDEPGDERAQLGQCGLGQVAGQGEDVAQQFHAGPHGGRIEFEGCVEAPRGGRLAEHLLADRRAEQRLELRRPLADAREGRLPAATGLRRAGRAAFDPFRAVELVERRAVASCLRAAALLVPSQDQPPSIRSAQCPRCRYEISFRREDRRRRAWRGEQQTEGEQSLPTYGVGMGGGGQQ